MAAVLAPVGYYNPQFFTPFYFPSWEGPALPGGIPTARYFAPEFFSPFYFAPLLPIDSGMLPVPEPLFRDYDGFATVVAALRATGEFADVVFGATAERWAGGVDLSPIAVITPQRWSESDDTDPIVVVRQVSFSLAIAVRDDDTESGFNRLDRLVCTAQNAIEGSDLGGSCLPALTRLNRGFYDPSAVYPEMRVVLQGEFTYLIPSPNRYSTGS
jgi:hypothetical protein